MNFKVAISIFILFFSWMLKAQDVSVCLENAHTQLEMNNCEGIELQSARSELLRVLKAIEASYESTSPEFLIKLKHAQEAWEASLEADLEMKFPLEDKRLNYGSVYPMCSSGYETKLVLQRIEFLKQWASGHQGGEVCSGSIIHEYCVENDCSLINQ
ncbi:lysozyme inhibitor LprI family protein [Agaribacter flavus]|uniref:Lysozyme inhibitor LprI family protein n=1 Tax=Agaribacter flavus TaxID=1902781 RepID=A0ABV7FWD3_9ALTE